MEDFRTIIINKNRGWRGLAEVKILDKADYVITKNIFSFSQDVWDDLIQNYVIVIQDEDNYYVIEVDHTEAVEKLPKPEQQRSVLIKNIELTIRNVNKIKKTEWTKLKDYSWSAIRHFIHNRNNHTTSDWNNIGIRVIPSI